MQEDFSSYLPLSPATLHILLSLAAEDRHGYGMMQEGARQSEGQYKLGPGTLYDHLQKLIDRKSTRPLLHAQFPSRARRRGASRSGDGAGGAPPVRRPVQARPRNALR